MTGGRVKLPTSYEEAAAMWLLGERWIRDNCPEKLKPVGNPDRYFIGERRRMFIPDSVGAVGDRFYRDGTQWYVVGKVSSDGETALCEVVA